MKKYILALDEGTTSCRSIIFDHQGQIVSMAQKEFGQYYPNPGWVEHNALEIWGTQLDTARIAISQSGAQISEIAAIGITNQRETVVMWDKNTGDPVCPAIVWQCRRSADIAGELIAAGLEGTVKEKTGLLIDPYFSGTKIKWIFDNIPGIKERALSGDVLFGTIDTYLIWKLTGGKVHETDYSNACRTMIFNIHTLEWDKELCDILGIPMNILPKAVPSSHIFGDTDPALLGGSIPIAGAAGDQQAALFGQCCFEKGMAKNTYGTGGFLLMNAGDRPIASQNGLVTTIAWGLEGKITYALEGSVFMAGASIQWLRDDLKILETAADSEYMAMKVMDTAGCYVVPAFTGLGAPYWDPYARGAIVGLTRGVNKYHIIRATLEAMALQTMDVLKAMESDVGVPLENLYVDGGASANNLLLQMQADYTNVLVERPACVETTALGAVYLAGLAVGFWKDQKDIAANRQIEKVFTPAISTKERINKVKEWKKAVNRTLGWAETV